MRRLVSLAPLATIAVVAVALTGCITPPPLPEVGAPQAQQGQGPDASGEATGVVWPRNMASHGVVFTADGVLETPAAAPERVEADVEAPHAILYVDYQCPHCATFMSAHGDELEAAVSAGEVALEVRPLTFLDSTSTGEHSTRAANALAAVADEFPEAAWAFHRALLDAQPAPGEPGLTDAQLLEIAAGAGASSAQLTARVEGVELRAFTAAAGESNRSLPVVDEVPAPTGTPAFYLDGERFEDGLGEPGAIADFIASQR